MYHRCLRLKTDIEEHMKKISNKTQKSYDESTETY